MHVLSSSSLTGTNVVNSSGENLGEIKELMIDLEHGIVAYAVLDFGGGILGLNNKLFALPWKDFAISTKREVIVLDVPREKLEQAEGFDPDNWPDMSDPDFASRIFSYYGYDPYWGETIVR